MSIRFDAAGDYIVRSTGLPTVDPISVCAWLYISVDRNDPGVIFEILNGTGTQFNGLLLSSTGTNLRIDTQNGGTLGTSLSVGTWYHVAYTRNGASHKAYLNGVLDITHTDNNAMTAAFILMGSNSVSYINGRLAAIKIWSGAELTAAEIANEYQSILPRRYANLYAWYPTFAGATERLADYSGNGRVWTAAGTLADEAPPPVAWGSAVELLPYAAASGGEITGTLDATLGALTLSSAGTVDIAGIASPTLGSLTVSAAGTVDVVGSASITLGSLTSTADGTVDIVGAASITLGSLTSSAAGTVDVSGGVAITLGALTLSGAGGVEIVGVLNVTLSPLILTASSSENLDRPQSGTVQDSGYWASSVLDALYWQLTIQDSAYYSSLATDTPGDN